MENEINLYVYLRHPDGWFLGGWSVWVGEWAALLAVTISREMVMHNFWFLPYMRLEDFHVIYGSNLRYLVFSRKAWVPSGTAETRQGTIKHLGFPWPWPRTSHNHTLGRLFGGAQRSLCTLAFSRQTLLCPFGSRRIHNPVQIIIITKAASTGSGQRG